MDGNVAPEKNDGSPISAKTYINSEIERKYVVSGSDRNNLTNHGFSTKSVSARTPHNISKEPYQRNTFDNRGKILLATILPKAAQKK